MKKVLFILVMAVFAVGSSAKDLSAGYRGFVEAGYAIGIDSSGESRIELMTTHGYQVIPNLFLGAGIGVNYYGQKGLDNVALPLFVDARFDLNSKRFAPFADFKIGYSPNVNEIKGLFTSLGGGLRFNFNPKFALNFGVFYSLQKFNLGNLRANADAIALRVGFEF